MSVLQSWNTNFGPNSFEENPPEFTHNDEDVEYLPCQVLENNHPPSHEVSKTSGGSPVEQAIDLEEESSNEIRQETHSDEVNSSQNTQKDKGATPKERTPKTPENSQKTPLQEEPINTTCDLTLTQIILTLTDTKKQTSRQSHLFCPCTF